MYSPACAVVAAAVFGEGMRCARCVGIDVDNAMTTWVGCEDLQACALRLDRIAVGTGSPVDVRVVE
ncbi:hypothetical protein KWH01_07235 [Xanthomonas campestris pv. merremiae]|uniref:hypothetical protein n=1 Tax=Xanthomonas citri TaxID=346 RepID=UPI0012FE36DD|nr:hypothetical protein [Xanthomonas citri]MBV6837073.1 hypothetical protein [Xanthomonas campestris pv. merremiae]MCC8567567.1 hypothetical protein [Xanthomonas citri pv. fuscans]